MSSPVRKLEQLTGGLRCAAVSDVGMRRASNQDSLAISLANSPQVYQSHGHLFVVADGMGAHAAGELASELATENIPHSYHKLSDLVPSEAIVEAVRQANSKIYNKGQGSVDFQGMGTTCSCLVLMPCGALVAHVGDSRVYRLRGGSFEQLTFDHSLVWEMAAAGRANEEDIPAYVPKNVITRSLGPHPTVAVDVEGPFDLRSGDRFLLCSDGLTGPLKPELIGMVIGALPPAEAAQTLADLANLLGGPDNITSIVAEVLDTASLGQTVPDDLSQSTVSMRVSRTSRVHPLCWAALALCAILMGGFASLGLVIPAFVSGLGLIVATVVSWMQFSSEDKSGELLLQEAGLRGKAPYRRHDCMPSAGSIKTLTDIVRQLEDLEAQRDWEFDWELIHKDRDRAHEATSRGDFHTAVVAYCSAVRRLMQALRENRDQGPSDSSLDFD
jgi:serine/threonine protein phosphatase PrpC